MRDPYQSISIVYNALSSLYSFGAVPRCRMASLRHIASGSKVCFVGVGQGEEAIAAVLAGAQVTVVDISASMLARFKARLDDACRAAQCENSVRVIQADVFKLEDEHQMVGEFDMVVAHFFLNVFDRERLPKLVSKLTTWLGSTGRFVVGDFYYHQQVGAVVRLLQRLNWYLALVIFRLIVRNAWHPIYDYDAVFEEIGYKLLEREKFCVLAIPLYHSSVYVKNDR